MAIDSTTDLLILLLYAKGASDKVGESIKGNTKLQKLLFLLGKEGQYEHKIKNFLNYSAYKFGPHTPDLYDDLELLKSMGIISITKTRNKQQIDFEEEEDFNEKEEFAEDDFFFIPNDRSTKLKENQINEYSLTEIGLLLGEKLFENLSEQDKKLISNLKTIYNPKPYMELLRYVYTKYPELTTKSEIKDMLGIEI